MFAKYKITPISKKEKLIKLERKKGNKTIRQ